jgi:hypothetical protein
VQQTFQCVCLHTWTHISQLSPVFLAHSNIFAQHINTRHCLTSRFTWLQARLQSAGIRKVLRPAKSIKIFLRSSQVLHQTLSWDPKPTLQPSPKQGPFHAVTKVSLRTQNQPQCPPLAPAAHPNTPLRGTVPFALTKALPCYQPAFTRRTSGHCLWAVRTTNSPDSSPPSLLTCYSIKCSACHCTPVFSLSLFLCICLAFQG